MHFAVLECAAAAVYFRGEYGRIRPERQYLVRNLIYPVPEPGVPFLGVHFTQLIHDGVEAGPNAVLALACGGYRRIDFSLRDTIEYPHLPRILAILSAQSPLVVGGAEAIPEPRVVLPPAATPGAGSAERRPGSGRGCVPAQAMSPAGSLVQEFCFVPQRSALHVLNAPCPAVTASLAIAHQFLDDARESSCRLTTAVRSRRSGEPLHRRHHMCDPDHSRIPVKEQQ